VIVLALLAVGTAFVVAGTLGLLRFPDLPTRLHAVAKADNLGLGFIVAALIVDVATRPDDGSPLGVALKLVLIWLLALLGTAANSHLLAGHARATEISRGTIADAVGSAPRPRRRPRPAEADE
jgi:multicomponent Na+:H+ antiporter subunit G